MALAALLLSPRDRRFYFGAALEEPGRRLAPAGGGPAPLSPRSRAEGLGLPLPVAEEVASALGPVPAEAPVVRHGKVRVPEPDADGRIRVRVTDLVPARLPASGPPAGWDLQEFAGHANVQIVLDDGRVALDLQTDRSSFAVYRDVVLDPKRYPRLRWSWKAVRLPRDGDARYRATDDEVAQIYIVFPRWPAPRINSEVLGYLWDTHAPVGAAVTSPQARNVRSIVVESGTQRLGVWVQEERDVYADFLALFGREPGRVGKVAIMTDSNDTLGQGEALVDDLIFFRPLSRKAKIGSIYAKMPPMLRSGS